MSMWDSATFRLIDPRVLLLDQNARTIVDIQVEDPALVASVKQHGVLVPLIANPAGDGRVRVRDGHSRALAAVLAVDVHPVVPVLVTGCTDEEQWHRMRDQWIANEIRRGFTTADKARVLEQMTLFGLSEEEIASQLSTSCDTVQAGLRVRASDRAGEALVRYPQLSLVQVAAFAEFEAHPQACARLEEVLADEPDQFDHVASELRHQQAALAAREDKASELRAAGLTVLTGAGTDVGVLPLRRLQASATDHTYLGIDPQAHAGCPGHAAIVNRGYAGAAPSVEYVCQDWRDHGHVDTWASPGARPRTGPRTEVERAQLRRVRVNNEKWRAAMEVRRAFLQGLLARTTPPRQAQRHLLLALATGGPHLTRAMTQDNNRYACELLGLKQPRAGRAHPIAVKAKRASADQALMLSLAVVLAAFELAYDLTAGVGTWRSPTPEDRLYFTALKDWGYPLSTVEQLVLDPAADATDWPQLQTTATAPADGDELDPNLDASQFGAQVAADTDVDTLDPDTVGLVDSDQAGGEVIVAA